VLVEIPVWRQKIAGEVQYSDGIELLHEVLATIGSAQVK